AARRAARFAPARPWSAAKIGANASARPRFAGRFQRRTPSTRARATPRATVARSRYAKRPAGNAKTRAWLIPSDMIEPTFHQIAESPPRCSTSTRTPNAKIAARSHAFTRLETAKRRSARAQIVATRWTCTAPAKRFAGSIVGRGERGGWGLSDA